MKLELTNFFLQKAGVSCGFFSGFVFVVVCLVWFGFGLGLWAFGLVQFGLVWFGSYFLFGQCYCRVMMLARLSE